VDVHHPFFVDVLQITICIICYKFGNLQYVKNMQNVGYVTIAMWVLMLASLLTLDRLVVRVKFQRWVKEFK
jgi:hypothetical protein